MVNVIRFIDSFINSMGKGISWLTLLMVTAMFTSVLLSFFKINAIAFQESITWMHGMVFLMGAAYTLQKNEHVRVDIFYQKMSVRQKSGVNLLGSLFFLIPVSLFIIWMSHGFVVSSWQLCEVSNEAGGLPGRYFFRTLILLLPALLLLQGIAEVLRNAAQLLGSDVNNTSYNTAIDHWACLSLAITVCAYVSFSVIWIVKQCNANGSQVGLYSLILLPMLVIAAQSFYDAHLHYKQRHRINPAPLPQDNNQNSEV